MPYTNDLICTECGSIILSGTLLRKNDEQKLIHYACPLKTIETGQLKEPEEPSISVTGQEEGAPSGA